MVYLSGIHLITNKKARFKSRLLSTLCQLSEMFCLNLGYSYSIPFSPLQYDVQHDTLVSIISIHCALKGAMPRDFRLQVFYMDQFLPSP